MEQHIDIEDVVIPLRTYAWAITGSVNIADQLVSRCFEEVGNAPSEALPTTKLEWFEHIDNVVVDWMSSEHKEAFPERHMVAETIRVIADVKPGILYHLLERSMKHASASGKLFAV